jgi:negative regulator of replication initiation
MAKEVQDRMKDLPVSSRVVITNTETQKKSPTVPHLMRKLMEAVGTHS